MKALFWSAEENGKVQCELCPLNCILKINQTGPCGTRANINGEMKALQYGKVVAVAVDPIEKKPLRKFHSGSQIFSIAGQGCNLHCSFCQNWKISQHYDSRVIEMTPQQVIEEAVKSESFGVAYTYSEPLVWYEFVYDTAQLAHRAGLKNVLVTNGYINEKPLQKILPFIDAANIDLKSIDESFYKTICKAEVEPVKNTIRKMYNAGVHVEVTNLIIPGYNDSVEQVNGIVDFIIGLSDEIPLHLSAYYPANNFDAPRTPPETIKSLVKIALARLQNVYAGNVNLL
jgi:pyruvate formate lyase activating enzyme